MKPDHKAMLQAVKVGGIFCLAGAGVLAVVGNPAAWAVLGLTTYQVGKTTYRKEQDRARLQQSGRDPDLFI